jgi:hypothetical protein
MDQISEDFVIYEGVSYEKDTYMWHALCIEDIKIREEFIRTMDRNTCGKTLHKEDRKAIIDWALHWSETEQGHSYWSEIDRQITQEEIKMTDYPIVCGNMHKKIFDLLKS